MPAVAMKGFESPGDRTDHLYNPVFRLWEIYKRVKGMQFFYPWISWGDRTASDQHAGAPEIKCPYGKNFLDFTGK